MANHQEDFRLLLSNLAKGSSQSKQAAYADFTAVIAGTIADTAGSHDRHQAKISYIQKKYAESDFALMEEMLSCVSLAYQENPRQDFLGKIIMDENLVARQAEENYIPYDVAEVFAQITARDYPQEIFYNQYLSVVDPYCASGATVIATLNKISDANILYPDCVMCTCQATDETTAQTCYIQLSLLGCAASVSVRITPDIPILEQDLFVSENALCTMAFYNMIWHKRRMEIISQFPMG